MENTEKFSGQSLENGPVGRQKDKAERAMKVGRITKRGDSKVESNDSPEIPDRGETSDFPSPPWRGGGGEWRHNKAQ